MDKSCPIESTLALINGKWRILILKALTAGPLRYGALERQIPAISAKVLTQQLREMQADGLVLRTIYPEIPPRVEYELSSTGLKLFKVIFQLRKWGLEENPSESVVCSGCGDCQIAERYKRA
ncbi:MAG: helix-turn-helix transcriptional regulator [Christensenellaceae bacterium]|jgi:DNA-binding HxlR family transcriptional regulator|nr:helix-turn-helix transcriptional regulator [Christensenellaceae bacterium]